MNNLERIKTHVAPSAAPLVVLFGQHRADQANDGLSVGEDRYDVRSPADLTIESLLGIVRPDLPPMGLREGGKGQGVLGRILQKLGGIAEALGQLVDNPTVLRPDLPLVGLGKDRAIERRHEVLRCLGDLCQQIARKMSCLLYTSPSPRDLN